MTNSSSRMAIVVAAALMAAMGAAVVKAWDQDQRAADAQAQAEKAKAQAEAQAIRDARTFDLSARVMTLHDRTGNVVGTAGARELYGSRLALSPDRTRAALMKRDQQADSSDLWVLDLATGTSTRLTTRARGDEVGRFVWSPDGRSVASVQSRSGNEGVYRLAANGEGPEELLYRNPGAFMDLSDWSQDGRFLAFTKSDLLGSAIYVLPITGPGEHTPMEVFRSEARLSELRFSPDGRFLSYVSTMAGERSKIFVRPIDASSGAGPWEVAEGSRTAWRRDGRELTFVAAGNVMVAPVSTSPTFTSGTPTVLFRLPPGAPPGFIMDISRDGERFVTLPAPRPPPLQQLVVYDRTGKATHTIGEPGLYAGPAFSPDGARLVVMRNDIATGQRDVWIFEIATGTGRQLTNDRLGKNNPTWSPDGRQVLYVSTRGAYTGVYRRSVDGTGTEEFLFRYTAGAPLNLTDISPDGRFLACASGGVVLIVPLTGTDPLARQAVEFSREEFNVGTGRFSPDGRFLAYVSNEADPDPDTGRNEVYVRPFNPATGTAGEGKWQLSKDGVAGMQFWRGDGKEFFFRQGPRLTDPLDAPLTVMSAEVSTTPTFRSATPRPLFSLPGPPGGNLGNISRDGQWFVFSVNVK